MVVAVGFACTVAAVIGALEPLREGFGAPGRACSRARPPGAAH
jgi:hypothetical protein